METKGKYRVKGQHGGRRVAGTGKKIGRPADGIGSNPKVYADYLDDETIRALKQIDSNRSRAIRMLAKRMK